MGKSVSHNVVDTGGSLTKIQNPDKNIKSQNKFQDLSQTPVEDEVPVEEQPNITISVQDVDLQVALDNEIHQSPTSQPENKRLTKDNRKGKGKGNHQRVRKDTLTDPPLDGANSDDSNKNLREEEIDSQFSDTHVFESNSKIFSSVSEDNSEDQEANSDDNYKPKSSHIGTKENYIENSKDTTFIYSRSYEKATQTS